MKNKNLKLKIVLTNIKRIITSILFINVMPFYNKVVLATTNKIFEQATCYFTGPQMEIETQAQEKNYFIILVPIAIVIILIIGLIVGIKRHKNKKMENKDDK